MPLRPDHPAIVLDDGPSHTYQQLFKASNNLALKLIELGAHPSSAVALLLPRSAEMVVAIYGVLFAGACYIPVDEEYPHDRIVGMLEDSDALAVVTQQSLTSELEGVEVPVLVMEEASSWAHCTASREESKPSSADLVYIFYTSGTSGKPKGVMVEHRGLVKRIQWLQDVYPLSPEYRMLQKTTYTFGISEWEFFWPLQYGAQMFMAKPEGHKLPDYIAETMCNPEHNIAVTCFTPSSLAMVLEYMEMEELAGAQHLQYMLMCGEALPLELCVRFQSMFESSRIVNLYGPTEADMTYFEIPRPVGSLHSVPIGKPMGNVAALILDPLLTPTPIGVPGELHFGGANTARGYVKLPELTAEKFIPNPFFETEFGHPFWCNRIYKTGDLARWLPDGELAFAGRVDSQIKLRGFRIELSEIEVVLSKQPGVKQVVVIVHGKGASSQLVGYITPETCDVDEVLQGAARCLPALHCEIRSGRCCTAISPIHDTFCCDGDSSHANNS